MPGETPRTGAFEALSARVEALSAVVEVLEARERARDEVDRIICGADGPLKVCRRPLGRPRHLHAVRGDR